MNEQLSYTCLPFPGNEVTCNPSNPIIQSVAVHPSRGFAFKLSIQSEPDQQVLPSPKSYIYALWEENSDEAPGWYLAKVLSVDNLGEARLRYRKG